MSEKHLGEMELERAGEGEGGEGVEEHLHGCARCRSTVADYRWLGGEIGAALAEAAEAVRVPRPKWGAVRGRMVAMRRRQVVGWRASAAASAALLIGLMLSASPVLGTAAAAWTLPPQAMGARAPVTAVASGTSVSSAVTPTPVASLGEVTPPPTPALVLPPTPPESETL
jgi:anti-sigma factor RsiW